MRLFPALLGFGLAISSFAQTAPAPGEAQFTITQGGKQLGETRYTVGSTAGGEVWTSSGSMKLGSFAYSFNNAATVDAGGNLVRDALTGSVHGGKASGSGIRFDTVADATGRQFGITVEANGQQTTNTVDRHRNMVLAPDLDPAAYTLMARFALAQPQTAWVLIPKENGILVPAEYTRSADLSGTLNGRATPVRHSIVAMGGENALVMELFYTPDGMLMEADLNAQNFHVERVGWKLVNRPAPVAPPKGEAPEAPPQGQADPNAPEQQTEPPPQ